MRDVVVDTNVLFSAILSRRGTAAEALRAIVSRPHEFRICYTSHMMAEYVDVLYRPYLMARVSREAVDLLLTAIAAAGSQTMARPLDWIVYPDRDDKPFLEAAIYCDAVLLTGNTKDYPFAGVRVMTPAQFLGSVR